MKKDKLNIDANKKPANRESEEEQVETAETNMEIQDEFYDENKSNDIDPANLNNQTAILTDMD